MYSKQYNRKRTRQGERARPDQIKNEAGGFVWQADLWQRARRFLILGAERGTYYVQQRQLLRNSAVSIDKALAEDPWRLMRMIQDIITHKRAPRTDACIFAISLAMSHPNPEAKRAARALAPEIMNAPMLFQYLEYSKDMRGWGPAQRKLVSDWYQNRPLHAAAYQVVKYRNRLGWTHKDILKLAHPRPKSIPMGKLFAYIARGDLGDGITDIIYGYERAKAAGSADEIVDLIGTFNLTHEMIPSEWQNDPRVMMKLMEKMPANALLRRLSLYSHYNLFNNSTNVGLAVDKINNVFAHPVDILNARLNYEAGIGERMTWPINGRIIAALEDAFYRNFKSIQPTNAHIYQAIDVSGSMTWASIAGTKLNARTAATVMAMCIIHTEPNLYTAAFSDGNPQRSSTNPDFYTQEPEHWRMVELPLHRRMSLAEAITKIQECPAGGTDCALPMLDATQKGLHVDAFIIYTDSQTWAGSIHPYEALRQYRLQYNRNAKLIIVQMTAESFTICDPLDLNSLDVCGFDTNVPQVISNFIRSGWELGE